MEIYEGKMREILDEQLVLFQCHVDIQMVKQREDFQHVCGIMKKEFDSRVQLIGEQYNSIKQMIESIAKDLRIIKSDIEFMKGLLRKKVDNDEFLQKRR
jgi:hypothetical protein